MTAEHPDNAAYLRAFGGWPDREQVPARRPWLWRLALPRGKLDVIPDGWGIAIHVDTTDRD